MPADTDSKIDVLRTYKFDGIYPNVVSSIPLDYVATDQIEEFQVTFNYLYWTVGEKTEDGKSSGLAAATEAAG